MYLLHELKVPDRTRVTIKKNEINPTEAGEELECQRTTEVTDSPLAAAAWESQGEVVCTLLVREMPSVRMRIKCSDCCRGL